MRVEIPVTGMTCASCVGRVEQALEKVPGVLEANVNLANEKATIRYSAGEVEHRDLEMAVEGAGYGLVRGEGRSDESGYEKLEDDFLLAAALTALFFAGSLPMMLGFEPLVPMMWLSLLLLGLWSAPRPARRWIACTRWGSRSPC